MEPMPISVPVATPATLPSESPARNIRRTVLPNGLLVLTESIPHVRSVSMGVWIRTGSRDEPLELNGISHFVEHMVFKGTTTRNARQFAREVDSIGGNLDAFTGKENICFNIKVLDENIAPALELLSDLVLHPTFTPEDIRREQGVILEEIKMDEDSPDYLVHETFTQNFWKGHALGRPTLGTLKSVPSFTQPIVFDFYNARFTPRNMVFSAAGNLDHECFVAQVAERFSGLAASSGDCARQASRAGDLRLHHAEAQEVAGAGAALPGRSGPAGGFAHALRRLSVELDSGQRHELAPLPDHPRRPRAGLLHLLRDQPLPRHRRALASTREPRPRRPRR